MVTRNPVLVFISVDDTSSEKRKEQTILCRSIEGIMGTRERRLKIAGSPPTPVVHVPSYNCIR